jgi:hypothetical protein
MIINNLVILCTELYRALGSQLPRPEIIPCRVQVRCLLAAADTTERTNR